MVYHPSCAGTPLPVRLMIATPDDKEYHSLRRVITGTSWTLFRTNTIADGLSTVINHKINVILTACDLPDGTWLEMVTALKPCRNAPRILVASPQADDRLWLDVLESGGYDLLRMPFDRQEVVRVVQMACLSWGKHTRGLGSPWFPVEPPRDAKRIGAEPVKARAHSA